MIPSGPASQLQQPSQPNDIVVSINLSVESTQLDKLRETPRIFNIEFRQKLNSAKTDKQTDSINLNPLTPTVVIWVQI